MSRSAAVFLFWFSLCNLSLFLMAIFSPPKNRPRQCFALCTEWGKKHKTKTESCQCRIDAQKGVSTAQSKRVYAQNASLSINLSRSFACVVEKGSHGNARRKGCVHFFWLARCTSVVRLFDQLLTLKRKRREKICIEIERGKRPQIFKVTFIHSCPEIFSPFLSFKTGGHYSTILFFLARHIIPNLKLTLESNVEKCNNIYPRNPWFFRAIVIVFFRFKY